MINIIEENRERERKEAIISFKSDIEEIRSKYDCLIDSNIDPYSKDGRRIRGLKMAIEALKKVNHGNNKT